MDTVAQLAAGEDGLRQRRGSSRWWTKSLSLVPETMNAGQRCGRALDAGHRTLAASLAQVMRRAQRKKYRAGRGRHWEG